jgi:integrase
MRGALRRHQLSPRTEQAYVSWVRRYVRFHRLRHPAEMGQEQVIAFLTWLAAERDASRSTQVQATSALIFLYREVIGRPLDGLRLALRGGPPVRLPVVLTAEEAVKVLDRMHGVAWLVGMLLYGSGLRLLEALTLRSRTSTSGAGRSGSGEPRVARTG